MALILSQFSCEPEILTPNGGAVRFRFTARATSAGPSHMQARFWIADNESFAFSPTEGGSSRQVFFPSATTRTAAPTSATSIGPKRTTIVPRGRVDGSRTAPLQINLDLQGFDAAGNPVGTPRQRPVLITMDPVSMALGVSHETDAQPILAEMDPVTAALRLVSKSLGITQDEISKVLQVSPGTVSKVMRGESSPKLRQALLRIFKGQQE